MAKDHPENPITIKPETVSHTAEQLSWVPLPSCSPPGCPFPVKSLALSARVSSDNSFLSVRQEPSFGPWKGSPFLQYLYPINVNFSSFPKQTFSNLDTRIYLVGQKDCLSFSHDYGTTQINFLANPVYSTVMNRNVMCHHGAMHKC